MSGLRLYLLLHSQKLRAVVKFRYEFFDFGERINIDFPACGYRFEESITTIEMSRLVSAMKFCEGLKTKKIEQNSSACCGVVRSIPVSDDGRAQGATL